MSSVDDEWAKILEAVGDVTPEVEKGIKAYYLQCARRRQQRHRSKREWSELLAQVKEALADFK
ncbi:hypothetical protein [Shimazuella alba]|uniref:Uncharacterized protein n=1 Tax=Shimazuella alba TaxID=2690964 RepID=A0A6I4W2M0_9BACL|nr:hypothetical protein [Shimazuella alba]MXQ55034.1 hypothetical protein [Shimazuella alba]